MKITILQTNSRNKFPFNIGALLIKYFQKTNYSHYAIMVEDPANNSVYIYDSTHAGARKRSVSEFAKHNYIYKGFVVPKTISYIDWLEFWAKHANKRYPFVQLIGLLLKGIKVIKHNPFGKGSKRLICNELVILLLNTLDYTCIKDTDSYDLVDTEEILKRVLK